MLSLSYLSDLKYSLIIFLLLHISGPSLEAEEYSWSTVSEMPNIRVGQSAAVIDGKIFVFGGVSDTVSVDELGCGGIANPKMDVFDPMTNKWDTTKSVMHIGRVSMSACVFEGKIYSLGGQAFGCYENLSSIEVYDPMTNTWDTTKSRMPENRAGLSANVVNGKIYIIGGWNSSTPKYKTAIWEYDPINDVWDTTKSEMPTARAYLTTSVVDGKIYAFGGMNDDNTFDGLNTLEIYDPATNEWDTTKKVLPAARTYLKSVAVNDAIYIFGGTSNAFAEAMDNVWKYNTRTDTYEVLTPILTGVVSGSVSLVDSSIYLMGGSITPWPWNQFLQVVLKFDLITDIGEKENPLSKIFKLYSNHPNPFNSSTTIEFTLPKSEFVELKVYNILGKEVSTLVSTKLNQGNHTYTFDGSNLASGIYYYQLTAGDPSTGSGQRYREVKKMILLK